MKQSIQKHDISNLSPLAPALRGLEDARTQRWTFCEPCSMEQNVQVQGEHCQHGKTIKHVWENAKMPKHRASKATVLTMSMDWEPHAKPDRWTQRKWFMTRSLTIKKAYKHNRNGQHSEEARSMKWAVVDMFAKSEFGTREICSQLEKCEKTYIWRQYSIFLIKGPRNSQNEFRESHSGHFRTKLKAKNC